MKGFLNIFGIAAAGVLGYLAEPALRVTLTGIRPDHVEIPDKGPILVHLREGGDPVNLTSLAAGQLPAKIKVKVPVKATDAAATVKLTIETGSIVKLVRIEGTSAIVSPGEDPFEGKLPVAKTDLLAQLAENPPGPVVDSPVTVPAEDSFVPEPATPPAGESEEPEKTPEAPPEPEPAPEPEIPATPAVDPLAIPEPAPMNPETEEGETTEATSAEAAIIAAMQASIKAGDIKEFTFEQVTEWKATPDEKVEGKSYQTGLASYSAETIFGEKRLQAKALIASGKVSRWIWPKSGAQVK